MTRIEEPTEECQDAGAGAGAGLVVVATDVGEP
jgi:hypothetical protein